MVEMRIHKFEIIRVVTVLLGILVFTISPIFGVMYGTTSALTFGSFTVISPLEWILVSLSTQTILISLLVPVLIVILIIALFGRFFCGWICPVGMLLDYSHNLTVKNNKKNLSPLWRNMERYVILLAILTASLLFKFTAPYLFSPPGIVYRTIIHIIIHGIIGADLAVLLLIFILDVFATRFDRTWCNTLCPLGTLISSLSIINLMKPKVDKKKCNNCLVCERICPMRIPIIKTDNWAMMACNKCLKCWENCPVKAIKIVPN
jgi:ferredoxin-type protein NapH